MVERVLIAVDESAAARKAVAYVGHIFGRAREPSVEVTLFHVVETFPPNHLLRQTDAAMSHVLNEALKAWSGQAVSRCEKQLERYKEQLAAAGILAAAIRVKFKVDEALPEARRVAAATGIIHEAQQGGYSTVVVGRRGASNIPEMFLGGIAEKVCRHVVGATVWIVD
jgi:nucleotide-binding universal stress UspA family protein